MRQPLPGEIWELNQLSIPISCHQAPPERLRVMIITEPEEAVLPIVSVMLLSEETNFLSEIDILIPSSISGLKKDLLAETWLVFPMFVCDLRNPTGARLSYQIYETLLDIGDCFHGLLEKSPTNLLLQSLGLKRGSQTLLNNDILKGFHSSEQNKSNILKAPIAKSNNQYSIIPMAEQALNQAVQTEQDLTNTTPNNIIELTQNTLKTPITITQWLKSIHQPEWQITSSLPKSAVATRSIKREYTISTLDEVSTLIKQLSLLRDESQKQSIAKRLGEIGKNNQSAIQALSDLIQTTQDDETLWTAVESLWQIDPGNAAVGVRRVKLIDLGIQLAGEGVALAVALIPKINNRFGVLLQVYPTGREIYLPPQLKLALLDTTGKVLRKVTAQLADVFIQLKFSGELGEPFSVKIILGEAEIIEHFVI
ncbi:hypothetical protein NIES4071_00910 [Calothrix sp. NIES-4071]|nr:hypothetical protein NIES4071_00910 [Calothrix sp. NIES-4071]BAZ54437.1 hypothetical protein NIES4105_00900 [Calothrix sp. NIES-4105]